MIKWQEPVLDGNEEAYLLDAFKSSWISEGAYVEQFEKKLSEILNVEHVVAVSNGTAAISLAYASVDLKAGDEIIVPGFCFAAVVNLALRLSIKVRYIDVDLNTWNIDPKKIEAQINNKTKAIVVVHNYGNASAMDEIKEICEKYNLKLIEDAAEALFSKYDKRYLGTLGDVGTFSFQSTKTIALGEGGALITNDNVIAERARLIKTHAMGSHKPYWHYALGDNFRLTNLHAAIGVAQLETWQNKCKLKEHIWNLYKEHLEGFPLISFMKSEEKAQILVWAVCILINFDKLSISRDLFQEKLLAAGIETRPGFYSFDQNPLYNLKKEKLDNSRFISERILSLPSSLKLQDTQIMQIANKIKELINEFRI